MKSCTQSSEGLHSVGIPELLHTRGKLFHATINHHKSPNNSMKKPPINKLIFFPRNISTWLLLFQPTQKPFRWIIVHNILCASFISFFSQTSPHRPEKNLLHEEVHVLEPISWISLLHKYSKPPPNNIYTGEIAWQKSRSSSNGYQLKQFAGSWWQTRCTYT